MLVRHTSCVATTRQPQRFRCAYASGICLLSNLWFSSHYPCPKQKPTKMVGLCFWWEWVDSNHLRLKPTDLQSAPALQLRRTPRTFYPPARNKQRQPVFASLRRGTQFSILAIASVKIGGAGSGTRTRISSLEGLRTSPCTMPATSSQYADYIIYLIKIKW